MISDMARENGSEAAALPKLLLDIIKQVDGSSENQTPRTSEEKRDEDELQEENIALNLPKVGFICSSELASSRDVKYQSPPKY